MELEYPIATTDRWRVSFDLDIGPPDRFPSDAEERLGKFTSLVAVALANAEDLPAHGRAITIRTGS